MHYSIQNIFLTAKVRGTANAFRFSAHVSVGCCIVLFLFYIFSPLVSLLYVFIFTYSSPSSPISCPRQGAADSPCQAHLRTTLAALSAGEEDRA